MNNPGCFEGQILLSCGALVLFFSGFFYPLQVCNFIGKPPVERHFWWCRGSILTLRVTLSQPSLVVPFRFCLWDWSPLKSTESTNPMFKSGHLDLLTSLKAIQFHRWLSWTLRQVTPLGILPLESSALHRAFAGTGSGFSLRDCSEKGGGGGCGPCGFHAKPQAKHGVLPKKLLDEAPKQNPPTPPQPFQPCQLTLVVSLHRQKKTIYLSKRRTSHPNGHGSKPMLRFWDRCPTHPILGCSWVTGLLTHSQMVACGNSAKRVRI